MNEREEIKQLRTDLTNATLKIMNLEIELQLAQTTEYGMSKDGFIDTLRRMLTEKDATIADLRKRIIVP